VDKTAAYSDLIRTRFGRFLIIADKFGILRIRLVNNAKNSACHKPLPLKIKSILRNAGSALKKYFGNHKSGVPAIQINWARFNTFERKVFRSLQKIPSGKKISYSGLAEKIGHPGAARAVGNALNRNPISILIPCHRVIRKDGSLGGYGGGIEMKKKLLKLETSLNK
jgi:O-6-methylguanine DNA methyltransferase